MASFVSGGTWLGYPLRRLARLAFHDEHSVSGLIRADSHSRLLLHSSGRTHLVPCGVLPLVIRKSVVWASNALLFAVWVRMG